MGGLARDHLGGFEKRASPRGARDRFITTGHGTGRGTRDGALRQEWTSRSREYSWIPYADRWRSSIMERPTPGSLHSWRVVFPPPAWEGIG